MHTCEPYVYVVPFSTYSFSKALAFAVCHVIAREPSRHLSDFRNLGNALPSVAFAMHAQRLRPFFIFRWKGLLPQLNLLKRIDRTYRRFFLMPHLALLMIFEPPRVLHLQRIPALPMRFLNGLPTHGPPSALRRFGPARRFLALFRPVFKPQREFFASFPLQRHRICPRVLLLLHAIITLSFIERNDTSTASHRVHTLYNN